MRELVRYFIFFFKLRRYTIVFMLLMMICAACFETLGVTMFLPVLQDGSLESTIGKHIHAFFAFMHMDGSLRNILILMVCFMFVRTLFLILQESYVAKTTADFSVDLRVASMARLFSADYLYFMSKDSGLVTNYFTLELSKLASTLRSYCNVLLGIVFSLFYTLLPLLFEPLVVGLLILIGVPMAFLVSRANHITRKYSNLQTRHSGWLQSVILQILHNFKYLKATFSQAAILRKFDRECNTLGRYAFIQNTIQAVVAEGFVPFVVLFVAGFLYFQVTVKHENMSQTLFFMLLLYRAISQILGIQTNYRKFLTSVGSINIYKLLDRELAENEERTGKNRGTIDFSRPIAFRDVSFKYPGSDYVLRDIQFSISPRSTVAFVGPSGAGKSTMVTLLTGILRPSEGKILIADSPYSELNMEMLRRGIGFVTQENVIFNDTVRNNITLWAENGKDDVDRIMAAARGAHIHDFIQTLPEGYETLLGDNGLKISGGQRQRVCIARELYKDAKVLIFDEATSSLDTRTEKEIQKNIDELRGSKTVILIAHRLSTVKNCDVIFVLKDGRIIEEGSYDQLYAQKGEFRAMVELQSTLLDEKRL